MRLFSIAMSLGVALSQSLAVGAERYDWAVRLKNWGLYNPLSFTHIHAKDAWEIEEGSSRITVAVIDTGISRHPSLNANLWKDPKNSSIYGWDFVYNHSNPTDEHGHGTHIAGIIGAIADEKTGMSGVAHHVSLMALKYYPNQTGLSSDLKPYLGALRYALDHGAKIINYSGGGPGYSSEEFTLLKEAEQKGVLVVTAAGNDHRNCDQTTQPYYPSAYPLSNLISVAASDLRGELFSSSNYGRKTVHVAAPGEKITSTWPNGASHVLSGTSQATAFVSGIAVLLLAHDPSLSPQEVKEIILDSSDPLIGLKDKVQTGARVNAYRALLLLEQKKGRLAYQASVFPTLSSGASFR